MKKLYTTALATAFITGCAQLPSSQPRAIDRARASCAKPQYPLAARRYEAEGTTKLAFTVDAQGAVSNWNVEQSSGTTAAHKLLDQAAVQALITCHYPATPGYGPARGNIQYVWKLDPPQTYADKIRTTFINQLILNDPIDGNPEAEVEIKTAPDGKILNTKLIKSSGSAAWDTAVQRAVARVDRVPLDADGKVPPVLVLSMRPR